VDLRKDIINVRGVCFLEYAAFDVGVNLLEDFVDVRGLDCLYKSSRHDSAVRGVVNVKHAGQYEFLLSRYTLQISDVHTFTMRVDDKDDGAVVLYWFETVTDAVRWSLEK